MPFPLMTTAAVLWVLFAAGAAGAAPAAGSIDTARELYAAAEYERALALLDQIRDDSADGREAQAVEQYRAFCLLALNRAEEAEQAISSIVVADPSFQPSDAQVSPRLRAAFRDVRRRVLPGVIQLRYEAARSSYDRQSFPEALLRFEGVLAMMDDPDVQNGPGASRLNDLRVLATGFRDLASAAVIPPLPPPPPLAVSPEPILPLPAVYSADDADVAPPVPVRQSIPPYPLPSAAARRGVVDVLINERGSVESIAVRSSLGDRYDRTLVEAARQWRYEPARRAGIPVKYRKSIQVTVAGAR